MAVQFSRQSNFHGRAALSEGNVTDGRIVVSPLGHVARYRVEPYHGY